MKFRSLIASAILGAGLGFAITAQAFPVLKSQNNADLKLGIELVAQGCGPGGFRGLHGFCRVHRRPIFRLCPRGSHLGYRLHCIPNHRRLRY